MADQPDVDAMGIKALKQLIESSGLSHADCFEKADLRARSREALARLAEAKKIADEKAKADAKHAEATGAAPPRRPPPPKGSPKAKAPPPKRPAAKPRQPPKKRARKSTADEWDSDAESEEEEVPSSSDEESVAESSDADSVKERKAAAKRPKAAKPADGTAFALWISTGQTSLGDDEKVLGIFYSWAQVVKRAKDVLADGHGHENWWCPKSKGGYLPDDGDDDDDDYGDREYFEDHTGSTAEPEGFISWRLASAKHGEGNYGNMALWAQRVQLPT